MDVTRATQLGTLVGLDRDARGPRRARRRRCSAPRTARGACAPSASPCPARPGVARAAALLPVGAAQLRRRRTALHDVQRRRRQRAQPFGVVARALRRVRRGAREGSLVARPATGHPLVHAREAHDGRREIDAEPLLRFQMRGAGYCASAVRATAAGTAVRSRRARCSTSARLDPLDYSNIHVQHVVRATSRRRDRPRRPRAADRRSLRALRVWRVSSTAPSAGAASTSRWCARRWSRSASRAPSRGTVAAGEPRLHVIARVRAAAALEGAHRLGEGPEERGCAASRREQRRRAFADRCPRERASRRRAGSRRPRRPTGRAGAP